MQFASHCRPKFTSMTRNSISWQPFWLEYYWSVIFGRINFMLCFLCALICRTSVKRKQKVVEASKQCVWMIYKHNKRKMKGSITLHWVLLITVNCICQLNNQSVMAILVYCILFAFIQSGSHAHQFHEFRVGGKNGWAVPNDTNTESYNDWAGRNRFQVGDSLGKKSNLP